jgi:uncharacterized protein
MKNSNDIIKHFNMFKHPEGGYFSETYRSPSNFQTNENSEPRAFCSQIYFLLKSGSISKFHRIKQDEMWHFYSGSAIEVHQIGLDGNYSKVVIGNSGDIFNFQALIPANTWMAATPLEDNSYTLIGCTVSPAFDFREFELARRADLIMKCPDLSEIIIKFT